MSCQLCCRHDREEVDFYINPLKGRCVNWLHFATVFILGIYRGNSPPKSLKSPQKVSKLCKTISLDLLVTSLYAAQNGRQLTYTVTCISVSTYTVAHGIKVTVQHQGVAA